MKITLSLFLVFVMVFSLCACGDNNAQNTDSSSNPNSASTDNTDESTIISTDGENESIEKPIKIPTNDPAPEPGDTSNPNISSSDEPSDCVHTYTTVSCTMPKMCTKCQHIAGNALPHNYKNGLCTECGRAEILVTFKKGDWVARTVKNGTGEQGEVLSEYVLDSTLRRYSSYICYSNANVCTMSTGKVIYNNKTYHSDWYFTTFTDCICKENGDTITVTLRHTTPVIEFVLTQISETQLKVISSNDTAYVPVGIVFVKQ